MNDIQSLIQYASSKLFISEYDIISSSPAYEESRYIGSRNWDMVIYTSARECGAGFFFIMLEIEHIRPIVMNLINAWCDMMLNARPQKIEITYREPSGGYNRDITDIKVIIDSGYYKCMTVRPSVLYKIITPRAWPIHAKYYLHKPYIYMKN